MAWSAVFTDAVPAAAEPVVTTVGSIEDLEQLVGGGVVDATGGRGRRGGGCYGDSDQRGSRCIRRVSWRSTSTTWRIDLPKTYRTWIGWRRCGSWRSLITRYHVAGEPADDRQ